MDTVTYPDSEVRGILEEHFVAAKCNAAEPQPEYQQLLRMARPLWTPTFLFLDPNLAEIRRVVGYRPPSEFVPELHMALGLVELTQSRPAAALERFRTVADRYPQAEVAPESLYWAGISAFRCDGSNKQTLVPAWMELRTRYPKSAWWASASCILGTLVPANVECEC
jgi:hypothetical protein